MATGYSPKIVTDGLVLCLDAGNRKSFKGEPTTNLVLNPFNFLSGYAHNIPYIYNNQILNFNNELTAGMLSGSGYFAYVDASTTNGIKYTTSWYLKAGINTTIFLTWGGAHAGNRTYFDFNLITGEISNLSVAAGEIYGCQYLNNGWWKVYYSSTLSTGNSYYPQINNGANTIYVGALQIEQKPYVTPFVNGTRGTTVATGGGWADLSGNANHGELVNGPTYNSSNGGSIVFDGSNDYIKISSATYTLTTGNSMELWICLTTKNRNQGFMSLNSGTGMYINFWMSTNNTMRWEVIGNVNNPYTTINSTTAFETNTWYNIIGIANLTNTYIYVNGILENSQSMNNQPTSITAIGYIGDYGTVEYPSTSKIAIAKFYNRPLTQQEILQNYNALKGRFGL